MLGGAGLVGASAIGLLALLFAGDDDAPVTLPAEVPAAPTAPSQLPDEDAAAQPARGERTAREVVLEPTARPEEQSGDGSRDEGDGSRDDRATEREFARNEASDEFADDPRSAAVSEPTRRVPAATSEPITFCFPGVIPTPDGCASRETVLAFAGEPIGIEGPGGAVEALTVTLADPDDLSAPEREVGTCDDYLALKAAGWGALTQAGMNRDLRMNRFCGLIAMADKAARPRRGGLARLSYTVLEQMQLSERLSLGEARLDNADIAMDADDDRLWRLESEALTATLRDVASADFDGDGRAEVLVHAALAARGGTARGGGYMLADGEAGGEIALAPANLYD